MELFNSVDQTRGIKVLKYKTYETSVTVSSLVYNMDGITNDNSPEVLISPSAAYTCQWTGSALFQI